MSHRNAWGLDMKVNPTMTWPWLGLSSQEQNVGLQLGLRFDEKAVATRRRGRVDNSGSGTGGLAGGPEL